MMKIAKFLYMGTIKEGKFLGTDIGTTGLIGLVEVDGEVWKVENGSYVLEEVAMTAKEEPQKIIRVFYENGYGWSVSVDGESESRETNLTKAIAMSIAKGIKKATGWLIDAQVLNKQEKKDALCARWETAKNLGWNRL